MLRARKLGVLTPCVLCVEHEASTIYFERVGGMSVKQALSSSALQPAGADSPYVIPDMQAHASFSHSACMGTCLYRKTLILRAASASLVVNVVVQGACLALHRVSTSSQLCMPVRVAPFNRAWSARPRSSIGAAASYWQRDSHTA